MKYLGIDIGSSFMKAFLMDTDRQSIVCQSSCAMPGREECEPAGAYEIDAARILKIVKEIIETYTGDYPGEIEGLLLSVQMHGFIYSAPGRPERYVSWQDTRCLNRRKNDNRSYLEYLKDLIPERDMLGNGVYLKPSMGICNLFAILEEDSSVPRNGTLYTLGSYMIHALTGKNITHAESLAPLGLLDIRNNCLNREIIHRLNFEDITFPRLAGGDYEICGIYDAGNCRIKVFPDYGDMQVAILGSDVHEGAVVINTATASQVVRLSSEFVPGEYEVRPYFGRRFLYTISDMPAGRNLEVLIHFLKEIVEELAGTELSSSEIWEKVHSLTGQQDADLKVDVNFYENPYFTEGGSIQHITQKNLHIGTLFSAAYQNMAETYWRYIQVLTQSADEIKEIICAGGVSWRTPELVQKIRQVSGRECRLSAMKDEAAAGLLSLALVLSGRQSETSRMAR